jgi:hypothetical protein
MRLLSEMLMGHSPIKILNTFMELDGSQQPTISQLNPLNMPQSVIRIILHWLCRRNICRFALLPASCCSLVGLIINHEDGLYIFLRNVR